MTTQTAARKQSFARAGRWRFLAHGLAWSYVLLLVLPLYYLIISSVKDNIDIFNAPFSPFVPWNLGNFGAAAAQASLLPGILSSIYVTVGAELLTLVLAIPAAYALARSTGRVGVIVERIFALGFLVPGFAALVPTVLLAIGIGMFHTREFLILLFAASALPLTVILLVQAMRAIPAELEESAMMDGANRFRVLLSIYLPLAAPTVTVVAILNFLSFWNEYFFSLVIGGTGVDVRTVQVALPTLSSSTNAQFGILAAGVVISLVPVYIVYVLLAKRMEGAVLSGALKA